MNNDDKLKISSIIYSINVHWSILSIILWLDLIKKMTAIKAIGVKNPLNN